MNIALLGIGNVGRPTYDIIFNKDGTLFKNNDINIKYVLIKSLSECPFQSPLFVTDYSYIINDPSVEVIIEMMGARVSYAFIKMALEAKKSVITANKEVIAAHFQELEELAKANGVKLFFEASVGGGIPVIQAFMNNNRVNNITYIDGILNGTTNFILTSMHKEKLSFNEALALAQKKGFAEADPTADLEGLDMVRKIAILSTLAYHGTIDIEKIYHFGIGKITKEFIDVVDLIGYTTKFMATSILENDEASIVVEPVILKRDALVSNVDYEYNVIRYDGTASGIQMMYGKGAGPKTANALVNDLGLLVNGFDPYIKLEKVINVVGNRNIKSKYLVEIKTNIPENVIDRNLNGFVITKEITGEKLTELLPKINFYARIIN